MRKKLKIKFIVVSLISVTVVLLLLLGTINIFNYMELCNDADEILEIIDSNNGKISIDFAERNRLSKEFPYRTRYFTVSKTNSSNILITDTGYIASISAADALNYANKVINERKTKGFIDNYRFLVNDSETMMIFLDCSNDIDSFNTTLKTSIFSLFNIIIAIFLLAYILSDYAIGPIVQAYEKQKKFITDISHELKTPLTIINANNDIIESENTENEWTISTKNQIKKLTELINKLISLSKMEEESSKIIKSEFNASRSAEEIASGFLAVSKKTKKTFDINIEPDVYINNNEKCLKDSVSILLDNAFKYSTDKGNVSLILYKRKKGIVIKVINDVQNIKTGNHKEFFDRFYRNDSSRNSLTGGNGIGLALAFSTVTKCGGKITAYSKNDHSIEFKIVF